VLEKEPAGIGKGRKQSRRWRQPAPGANYSENMLQQDIYRSISRQRCAWNKERRLQTWSRRRSSNQVAMGCASVFVMCFGLALTALGVVALILFLPSG